MHSKDFAAVGDGQGRTAAFRDVGDGRLERGGHGATGSAHVGFDGIDRALPDAAPVEVHAAHTGLRSERHEQSAVAREIALPQAKTLLDEHDDAAPLRRLVGKGGELSSVGEPLGRDARRGNECRRLPIAQSDGAGLVEQEHVDVAGRLDCAARHRNDVLLDHAIHARDADGGEQGADRGGNEAHEERHQHGERDRRALARDLDAEQRERQQRDGHDQEDDRERGEEDVERDLVRRLLPLGRLDQVDHPVEEGLARVGGDPDDEAVGEDAGSAGHRAPVATGLADDRARSLR